jgi:hypothetical protein
VAKVPGLRPRAQGRGAACGHLAAAPSFYVRAQEIPNRRKPGDDSTTGESMSATAQDELIDALCEVEDLDQLHELLSNDHTDRFAAPEFTAWLVELVNAERRRRETDEQETDYPMHVFWMWPANRLYQATVLALVTVEAALIVGEPTIQQFALRLSQVMVGSMGLKMVQAVCELEKING